MIRSSKRAILASFLAVGLLTMGAGQCQAGGRSSGGHYGGYGDYGRYYGDYWGYGGWFYPLIWGF